MLPCQAMPNVYMPYDLRGTFKGPDGEVIGRLLPGHGGEYGSLGANGILHGKSVFTVLFSDGKHGLFNSLGKTKIREWDVFYL